MRQKLKWVVLLFEQNTLELHRFQWRPFFLSVDLFLTNPVIVTITITVSDSDCDCDHDQYHKHKQFLPFIISSNRSSLRYHVPLQVRGSATFSLFGTSLTHLWDISGTSLRHLGDIFRTSSFSSIFSIFFFFAVLRAFLVSFCRIVPSVFLWSSFLLFFGANSNFWSEYVPQQNE